MDTIKDVFASFRQRLSALYDGKETEAITLTVLTEVLEVSKATVKAFPENRLTISQQEIVSKLLSHLETGKPLQYALGYAEFYGLKFLVNPTTLIPRPETEELVEWVLQTIGDGKPSGKGLNILDIGTGSGCIAISLKKNLPDAQVSAMDISKGALTTAKANAKLNNVVVDFIETDILNVSSNPNDYSLFDIIVSNPPYVTLEDKEPMHTNVTDFEPHNALFVPEDDPLIFYRAIAEYAIRSFDGGMLFFEINESLGKETVALLESKGFRDIELRQDMSGRDRMIRAAR
jgi:release factor glutamine methyltransferase